jgi:hypothetical protein
VPYCRLIGIKQLRSVVKLPGTSHEVYLMLYCYADITGCSAPVSSSASTGSISHEYLSEECVCCIQYTSRALSAGD